MILIIEGCEKVEKESELNNLSLDEHYNFYERQGLDKKEIIKKIAKDRGKNKNDKFMLFLEKK